MCRLDASGLHAHDVADDGQESRMTSVCDEALLELGGSHHGWLLELPFEEVLVTGHDELDVVRSRQRVR